MGVYSLEMAEAVKNQDLGLGCTNWCLAIIKAGYFHWIHTEITKDIDQYTFFFLKFPFLYKNQSRFYNLFGNTLAFKEIQISIMKIKVVGRSNVFLQVTEF